MKITVDTVQPRYVAPAEVADLANSLMSSGQVVEGLSTLIVGLGEARRSMSSENWENACNFLRAQHPVREKLYQDPMTRRAFDKPRGYAGDAVMMDYLYGIHYAKEADAQASETGRTIFRHIRSRPTSQAVVFRRAHIAELIDGLAEGADNFSVLAIASGHLREAELSQALKNRRLERYVALDGDADSLCEVAALYTHLGVEMRHASVRHLLMRKLHLGEFDFVYAAGLYDYLADNVAQALTARMFEKTRPGGEILIPNYEPSVEGRGYMECFMDWNLIYRDKSAMVGLLAHIDPAQIESYDIYTDPWESVVYLRVRKLAQTPGRPTCSTPSAAPACKSNYQWTLRSAPPLRRSAPRRLSTLHWFSIPRDQSRQLWRSLHHMRRANPGDVLIIWATGLGPVSGNDSSGAGLGVAGQCAGHVVLPGPVGLQYLRGPNRVHGARQHAHRLLRPAVGTNRQFCQQQRRPRGGAGRQPHLLDS